MAPSDAGGLDAVQKSHITALHRMVYRSAPLLFDKLELIFLFIS